MTADPVPVPVGRKVTMGAVPVPVPMIPVGRTETGVGIDKIVLLLQRTELGLRIGPPVPVPVGRKEEEGRQPVGLHVGRREKEVLLLHFTEELEIGRMLPVPVPTGERVIAVPVLIAPVGRRDEDGTLEERGLQVGLHGGRREEVVLLLHFADETETEGTAPVPVPIGVRVIDVPVPVPSTMVVTTPDG